MKLIVKFVAWTDGKWFHIAPLFQWVENTLHLDDLFIPCYNFGIETAYNNFNWN